MPLDLRVRPLVVLCPLLLLAASAPPAHAELALTLEEGSSFAITAAGAQSLEAPGNTTLREAWGGYVIDWDVPQSYPQEVAGYRIYRVPAPGTSGSAMTYTVSEDYTAYYDRPGPGTFVYFVTAILDGVGSPETIPDQPVSSIDVNYPHCNVASIYTSPPYYDVRISCLFPLP